MSVVYKPHIYTMRNRKLPDFTPMALYLHKETGSHNEDGTKLLYDETAIRQAERPVISNRLLLGNGSDSIALGTGISGTLTLKGWTKSGADWVYGNITTGLSGTTLTLQNAVKYGMIERYDNGVYKDVCLFEAGDGVKAYFIAEDGTSTICTITSSNINTLRTTGQHKPVIPFGGDFVGWGLGKAIDLKAELIAEGLTIPYTPTKTLSNARRLFQVTNLGATIIDIQSRAATQGDNSTEYVLDAKPSGVYSDADGLYFYLVNNYAKNQYSFLNFSDLSVNNAQYDFYFKINNPILISVFSLVLSTAVQAQVTAYNNGTDDPTGILSNPANYNGGILLFTGLKAYYDSTNSTRKAVFDAIFVQYSGKDLPTYYAATVTKQRIDLNLKMQSDIVVPASGMSLIKVSADKFLHNIVNDTTTANRTSALAGYPLGTLTDLNFYLHPYLGSSTYGGTAQDTKCHAYLGNIRNAAAVPKSPIYADKDINGELLVWTGPRDWPAIDNEDGTYDLAHEFWDRPAEWDGYELGDDTDQAKSSSSGRICVFGEEPTGERLTRLQRFTQ